MGNSQPAANHVLLNCVQETQVDTAYTFEIDAIADRLKTEFGTVERPLTPQMQALLERLKQVERKVLPEIESE